MKKRMLSMAMVIVMLTLLLSGCAKDKKSEETGNGTGAGTGTGTGAGEGADNSDSDGTLKKFDDVRLKMLICWNGGFKTATDQYNNEVAKAIRDKIGVTVEFEGIMMSETEKLNLMFASGDMPGALGIDPATIKTSDDLYNLMVKAKEHGFKDVNGNDCIVATTYHNGWDVSQYSINFSGKKFTDYEKKPDGTYTYRMLTDDWVNRELFIWKLVNQGLLDVECFKQNDAQADEKVGNGTALFAAAQYNVIINSTKLTGLYNSNPEMRYIPVGPMTYQDGSSLVQLEQNGRSGSPAIVFPTTCKNIEAAMAWLNYVNSEEGARLCQYGIEGDTYTMNDKGQPRLNADLLERKRQGDSTVDEELRQKGITYILGRALQADTRYTWWGETNPGDADAAAPELEAYKKARPVERINGYPLSGLVNKYEKYDTVKKFAFEGTTRDDYTQRAYFAETEAEARSILQDYQNYLLTQEGGIFKDYLDYVGECAKSRDDILD